MRNASASGRPAWSLSFRPRTIPVSRPAFGAGGHIAEWMCQSEEEQCDFDDHMHMGWWYDRFPGCDYICACEALEPFEPDAARLEWWLILLVRRTQRLLMHTKMWVAVKVLADALLHAGTLEGDSLDVVENLKIPRRWAGKPPRRRTARACQAAA